MTPAHEHKQLWLEVISVHTHDVLNEKIKASLQVKFWRLILSGKDGMLSSIATSQAAILTASWEAEFEEQQPRRV